MVQNHLETFLAQAADTPRIDADVEQPQRARMADLRERREGAEMARTLAALTKACRGRENLVPRILDCARVYATLYEIRYAMEKVFGAYREPVF